MRHKLQVTMVAIKTIQKIAPLKKLFCVDEVSAATGSLKSTIKGGSVETSFAGAVVVATTPLV